MDTYKSMSRNPFILAKLQKIRDNAAQRRHDRRVNTLPQNDQLYTEPTSSKTYTKEEIDLFKATYQKQLLKDQSKTVLAWILTLIITPFVCYLLIIFFFSEWF